MQDNMYTRALRSAAEIAGDAPALAERLRVPQNTLSLWMSGRSQMPVRAFQAVLDYLMGHEATGASYSAVCTPTQFAADRFTLAVAALIARCAMCDGTEFKPTAADEPMRLTSRVACVGCGSETLYGKLIAQLADDAVQQSRAMSVRTRRLVQHSRERRSHSEETIHKTLGEPGGGDAEGR